MDTWSLSEGLLFCSALRGLRTLRLGRVNLCTANTALKYQNIFYDSLQQLFRNNRHLNKLSLSLEYLKKFKFTTLAIFRCVGNLDPAKLFNVILDYKHKEWAESFFLIEYKVLLLIINTA